MNNGAANTSAQMWLGWSLRDFRSRWVAIVAISLVLAIGTGVYAGLGSTSEWRRQTNDASFDSLGMHDLRLTLSPGTFIDQGSLRELVDSIDDSALVDGMAERLTVDSQVAAKAGEDSILVGARLVGMTFGAEVPVDDVWVRDGAAPTSAVSSEPAQAILEAKFADNRGLPNTGTVTVGGGHDVAYTGLGVAPEDFFYEGPDGTVFAEGELAILYLPLESVQQITGRPDQVNDIVLTIANNDDRDRIETQIQAAVSDAQIGATLTTRDDADAVRVLYEDIDNDQRFWNAISALILGAAALAAFNLISRIVEAQRREIGIGMALGVPRRRLALRPLLIGAQVGVLGTIAGLGVALLIGAWFGNLLESFAPMPQQRRPFQFGVYFQGAALGLIVPAIAAALPVWRAVRVQPIEAIRTGHLAARSSRLTDWTAKLRLPGSTLTLMPVRNLLRNPRRSLLTALGVAAAVTALVGVLGMLDSFQQTLSDGDAEFTQGERDRVVVALDTFYPAESDLVAAAGQHDQVRRVDVGLRLPVSARASGAGDDVELLLEFLDLDKAAWTPTIVEGAVWDEGEHPGVVLARKAADDLAVGVGETLTIQHPVRMGPQEFRLMDSDFTVAGIHANPIRPFAFIDLTYAEAFGLQGATNLLQLYPADGYDGGDVQLAVFGQTGVGSSQPVGRISEAIDRALDRFLSFFLVMATAVLALALLISFNASRIAVEEREREHATMQAFGIPVRKLLGVVIRESVLIGIAATAIGVLAGSLFLRWMLSSLATTTLPDVGINPYISPTTIVVAALVGVAAVAVAPLFLVRRLQRMDLPGSLRIME